VCTWPHHPTSRRTQKGDMFHVKHVDMPSTFATHSHGALKTVPVPSSKRRVHRRSVCAQLDHLQLAAHRSRTTHHSARHGKGGSSRERHRTGLETDRDVSRETSRSNTEVPHDQREQMFHVKHLFMELLRLASVDEPLPPRAEAVRSRRLLPLTLLQSSWERFAPDVPTCAKSTCRTRKRTARQAHRPVTSASRNVDG
jgi:hypothetical protein